MSTSLAEARSHSITPEEFLAFDSSIREARREKEDASAGFARAQKSAKSGGVDLKAYKYVTQLMDLDEDEAVVVLRHMVQMLAWLESPLHKQFNLLEDARTMPMPTPDARRAHSLREIGEQGLKAGREGDPASTNPFIAGTEEFDRWSRKHAEGLAERATAARMQPDDDTPVADNTSIGKRGRKAPAKHNGMGGRGSSAGRQERMPALN